MTYYNLHIKGKGFTYPQVVQNLIEHYTSEEQRKRLLQEWHTTSLQKAMHLNSSDSQVNVFHHMFSMLMRTQRQLHPDYHSDRFLRDRIVASVDPDKACRLILATQCTL